MALDKNCHFKRISQKKGVNSRGPGEIVLHEWQLAKSMVVMHAFQTTCSSL